MEGEYVLARKLAAVDRKGYGAYKTLTGAYDFGKFTLYIDHVQSDPFAPPSRLRARVPHRFAQIPKEMFSTRVRRVALEDYLTRQFAKAAAGFTLRRGTGKSGVITIDRCGQEILERTSMLVTDEYVEARFSVGLPARGRTITADEAREILLEAVPQIVMNSLFYENLSPSGMREHVLIVEDQEYLRQELRKAGLVAFVANGSILPRESGISDRPLAGGRVVPFISPPELEVSFDLPNRGEIRGMGIPGGVTLIVGGGYHGKSTLLRAIERGVYNHIPRDGREFVITIDSAVKIRAEDGRSVKSVDISGFIGNLPYGQDTRSFSSENASGSTSQAANIVEALEIGAELLLLDEDTSATNFMIRDARMQRLVAKENEPITPFIDRVRELWENFGVSSIIVVGGSGDYFDVADLVIMMQNYVPRDVTVRAREIAASVEARRQVEVSEDFTKPVARVPLPASFRLHSRDKVKARGLSEIVFGHADIDLQYVEQLVDTSQTSAIAEIIRYAAARYIDGRKTLAEIIERVMEDIRREGLDVISPFKGQHPGDYALPRKFEIAAAINRYRGLQIKR